MSKTPQVQYLSIIPTTPLPPQASKSWKDICFGCLKAAMPIVEGALNIASDGLSKAVADQIDKDLNLTAKQKEMLKSLTSHNINDLKSALLNSVNTKLKETGVEADPRLASYIAAAKTTGLADAFAPGLISDPTEAIKSEGETKIAMERTLSTIAHETRPLFQIASDSASAILNSVVVTEKQMNSLLKGASKATAGAVVDLSSAKTAYVLTTKQMNEIVKDVIDNSELLPAQKSNLLKSGAAAALFLSAIHQSNRTYDALDQNVSTGTHETAVNTSDSTLDATSIVPVPISEIVTTDDAHTTNDVSLSGDAHSV